MDGDDTDSFLPPREKTRGERHTETAPTRHEILVVDARELSIRSFDQISDDAACTMARRKKKVRHLAHVVALIS